MTSSEDQLCLNISSNSSPSVKKNKPPSSKERWAAKNQRAQEWSMRSKGPDNKKRKLDDEPTPPPDEQPDKPPPKKREKRREEKKNEPGRGSGIKTSSLFKHNPEIPEIQRPDVAQLKEQIFTTDSFSDLDLHPHLVATLNKVLNVTTVTSVQKQTIPVLMSGRDAVVRSQTGSGKTLSYAVPMVQSLQSVQPKISRSDGPLALVIVPTRELAQQTFTTFQKLLKPFTYIVPGVLMGGEKRKAEKARLRKGINILITTPGRLVDHIKNTLSIAFSSVKWLVLDEADRILDLGFEKDLTVILNSLNSTGPSRQNVLLSATLTHGVSHLAEVCLTDPVNIHVSAGPSPSSSDITASGDITASPSQSEGFAVPEELQQYVVVVPSKVRLVCLAAFILDKCKFSQKNKVIVFVSSCEVVEFLHSLLSSVLAKPSSNQSAASVPAKPSSNHKAPLSFLRLHGNMKQEERSEVFKEFSKSHSGVLLCTDVAARGLDLHQVTWIVQYTPPSSVTEYVHRVGRTARIGETGSSLLFLTPSETAFIGELGKHNISLSDMKLQLILSSLMTDETYKGRGKYHSKSSPAALEQETRERATVLQTEFEDFVHSDPQSLQTAKKALQSFLRAYTTYPSGLKHIFHIKSLHLGHTAKSFGLRDAPQGLNTGSQGNNKGSTKGSTKGQNNKKNQTGHNKTGKRFSHQEVSEFSSGLEALHAKKKQKKKSKMESAGEEE